MSHPLTICNITATLGHDSESGPFLLVDCSAIATENQVHYWHLWPEDDGTWSHGPSGTCGSFGDVFASILGCYDPAAVERMAVPR